MADPKAVGASKTYTLTVGGGEGKSETLQYEKIEAFQHKLPVIKGLIRKNPLKHLAGASVTYKPKEGNHFSFELAKPLGKDDKEMTLTQVAGFPG